MISIDRIRLAVDCAPEKEVILMVNHELTKITRLQKLAEKLGINAEAESLKKEAAQISSLLSSVVAEIDEKFQVHYSPWFSMKLGPPTALPPLIPRTAPHPPAQAVQAPQPAPQLPAAPPLPSKSLLANERTFLSWLNIWLALAAFPFISDLSRFFTFLAILGLWVSLGLFMRRAKKIREDASALIADSPVLPAVTAAAFWFIALSQF
jgi:hypothetical protein